MRGTCVFSVAALVLCGFVCLGQSTGSGGGGVAGAATAHGSVSSPFSRSYAPYSGEETFEVVQALCDGAHITSKLGAKRIYRDSKGRTRTESWFARTRGQAPRVDR